MMGSRFAALALLSVVAARELAPRKSALAAPPRVAYRGPRGGGGGGGGHSELSPRELAAVIVADLTPHGMLPLAWAAAAGGGTGWAPALGLLAGFGAASTSGPAASFPPPPSRGPGIGRTEIRYTLYLCARLNADGSGPPALSTLWRGARLPAPRAVDALVATLCGGRGPESFFFFSPAHFDVVRADSLTGARLCSSSPSLEDISLVIARLSDVDVDPP